MILLESLKKIRLEYNYPLKENTVFRVGGMARYFFTPENIKELSFLIRELNAFKRNYYILGKGSNVLIKDGFLTNPVISLGKGFDYIREVNPVLLEVGAATSIRDFLTYCIKKGLGGLEVFSGIPASIGGLCLMNASSFGKEFFYFVEEVEVVDKEGKRRLLTKNQIDYGYRHTSLKEFIVTGVKLALKRSSTLRQNIYSFFKERTKKQDFSFPSLGCIFKNPQGMYAGKLIEECGLKGFSIGGASVSFKHANFILNRGDACFDDVNKLIGVIKDKVYSRFSIVLKEEIVRWEQ